MKPENLQENDARLNALLRQSRPAPSLPPRFQQEVWQRIHRGEAVESTVASSSWFDALLAWVPRPRVALAVALALIVVSGFAGALRGSAVMKDAARERYVLSVAPSAVR